MLVDGIKSALAITEGKIGVKKTVQPRPVRYYVLVISILASSAQAGITVSKWMRWRVRGWVKASFQAWRQRGGASMEWV